jgi:hypothetical protein
VSLTASIVMGARSHALHASVSLGAGRIVAEGCRLSRR